MFGEVLKELRTKKGISRKELAEKTGIPQPYLIKWEDHGQIPKTTGKILKLSQALEVDKEILLTAVCDDYDKKRRWKWD